MGGLPRAADSRAVLLGVSRYDTLAQLPAVQNNLPALAAAIMDQNCWNLAPEHCLVVPEPSSATQVLNAVEAAVQGAQDTLLVYFAGHGLVDPSGKLYLGLPSARSGRIDTGVPYDWLRETILAGSSQRQVVVLDCCFSGRALGVMSDTSSAAVVDEAQIDGSYLLAAAAEDETALAPPGETYTAFTAELLATLQLGIPGGNRWLDLESVYEYLRVTLRSKGRPIPQRRNRNTVGHLLLGANPAYEPAAAEPAIELSITWPNPGSLRSPEEFIHALAEVRALTGLTLAAVGLRAVPPLSAGSISALLNRTSLPARWSAVGRFLEACGLPAEQIELWHAAWDRQRPASQSQTPQTMQTVTSPSEGSKRLFRLRRRKAPDT
jgi:hypothetical protein